MIVTFRPLKARPPSWKDAAARRPYSPFSSTYSTTEAALHKELRHLGATNAFMQVERYGIAERGQQYAGFAELGSGTAMGGQDGFTPERAAELLAAEANRGFDEDQVTARALLDSSAGVGALVRSAYRDAVRLHHPDAGGSADMFRLLTAARDLLLAGA